MKNQFLILGIILSVVHFFSAFSCAFLATTDWIAIPAPIPHLCEKMRDTLLFPWKLIYDRGSLDHLSDAVRLLSVGLNSVLWGFAIAALLTLCGFLKLGDHDDRAGRP